MTVNVKTNNIGKSLAEIGNVSNPNLLINPDFKINQRGQTSYDFSTKSGYTVDRWFISRSKLTINSDNTITVDFTASGGVINQPLETTLNEQHTASINITKITGSIRFYIGTSKFITITSPGIYTITHDTNITQVSLYNPTGNNTTASCTIKWVKLEKGPIATQFIEPNPTEELNKCVSYYCKYNTIQTFQGINGQTYRITQSFITAMRTNPTCKISVSNLYGTSESNISLLWNNNINYQYTIKAEINANLTAGINIIADAEIY